MTRQETAIAELYRKEQHGFDFEVYTSELIPAYQLDAEGKTRALSLNPIFSSQIPVPPDTMVTTVGSSTIQDLHDDTMMLTALQDMTAVDPHLTIFMNHDYSLPKSLYGSLLCAPVIMQQGQIADLWLAHDTEISNPDAMQTLGYIRKGRRIGCSGGFKVTDYSINGEDDDWFAPLFIHHVTTVEWSLVGVPANQRSWVENAARGLFLRSILEDRGEEAIRLAPIVKGLYPRDYRDVTRAVASEGLRKTLERSPARGAAAAGGKILWEPLKRSFVIAQKEGMAPLSRAQVTQLLEGEMARPEYYQTLSLKTATGKTSWPLSAQDAPWDGSAAKADIFAWAADESEAGFSASKAKQCFFYTDPEKQDSKGGYKLPFTRRVDGDMHIIWKGVQAVANVLSGGRGGADIPQEEQETIKGKVERIYARARAQYSDPELQVPWHKEVEEEDMTVKAIAGLEVKADGTHGKTSGTHSHAHPSYGGSGEADADHEHDHTHDDDNNHDHGHDDTETEKSIEGLEVKADGNHGKTSGTHSHAHPAYGASGDDANHSHQHTHKSDSSHQHAHQGDGDGDADDKAVTPGLATALLALASDATPPTAAVQIDPLRLAKLSLYNQLGAEIGLPAVTFGTDGTPLLTLEAQAAELSAAHKSNLKMVHDTLFGRGGMHPDACGMAASAGAEGTGASPGGQSVPEAEAAAQRERESQAGYADAWRKSLSALTGVLKSFEGRDLDIKALGEHVVSLQAAAHTAREELSCVHTLITSARTEASQVRAQVDALKEMPLGRPTQMAGRVVKAASGQPEPQPELIPPATYQEMLRAGGGRAGAAEGEAPSLQEALAQTSQVDVTMRDKGAQQSYTVSYREWPAGLVPSGGRPALTSDQMSFMNPMEVVHYQEGQMARVPLIDEPVGAD